MFRQLREEMPVRGRLPLSRNFRSQPAILHFVNALFESELGPDYEPLVPDRQQVGPQPAIEFLWAVGAEDEDQEASGRISRLREREADWIARRLRAIVDSREKLVYEKPSEKNAKPTARAVEQGDIAILFRALSDVQYYETRCDAMGWNTTSSVGTLFMRSRKCSDVLNLLRTIASPADAVSLAGVLRSPIFSLDDETLFWLSQTEQGLTAGLFAGPLRPEFTSAQQANALRGPDAHRTASPTRSGADSRAGARITRPHRLRRYAAGRIPGSAETGELEKLVDQARSMDRAGIFTLADFIAQLSDFVVRQPDERLAATHAETANVVR